MSREAMQQALEALEGNCTNPVADPEQAANENAAITALRQALKTEKEPVAWISDSPTKGNGKQLHWTKAEAWRWSSNITPLYTAPPKQWVGLTEREVELIDEMIETQLLHAERCDNMANSTMAQKQKAWDLERVELLRKLKERDT